ncbi:hypothetical protein DPMN_047633 [Dreissena polymorpha]|uniref:C-type lectin domain-containing protein n=1 Tax=Dreissena polymorpha TaxID=45954 RepID=A0A9D4DAQ6_DREPO|nr:hypothetical protein DPMN_047633 [Dreissena polymorpha]
MSWVQAVFVVLCVGAAHAANMRCLECQDMPHPQDCDLVTVCTQYEVCYVEQFVTSGGLILYNSGCLAKNRCPSISKRGLNETSAFLAQSRSASGDKRQTETSTTDVATCIDCCGSSNYCNVQGCGEKMTPMTSRGPMCFFCHGQETPETCRTVQTCPIGQLCAIERMQGHPTVFVTKCERKPLCDAMVHAEATSHHRREVINDKQCPRCCSTDFCNDNCEHQLNITATTVIILTHPTTNPTQTTTHPTTPQTAPPTTTHPTTPQTAPPTTTHPTTPQTAPPTTTHPTTPQTAPPTTTHPTTHQTAPPTTTHPTTHQTAPPTTTHPTTQQTASPSTQSTAHTTIQPVTQSTAAHSTMHITSTAQTTKMSTTQSTTHLTTTHPTTRITTTTPLTKPTATTHSTTHPTTPITTQSTTKPTTMSTTTIKATTPSTSQPTTTRTTTKITIPSTTTTPATTTHIFTTPTTTDPKYECESDDYVYDVGLNLCLRFFTDLKNYTEAEDKCKSINGTLVVKGDGDQKMKDVLSFYQKGNYHIPMYVGATSLGATLVFHWGDGKTETINPNEGKDLSSSQCLMIQDNGRYTNFDLCSHKHGYICERLASSRSRR